jgi:hypothetical protein
MLHLAWAYSRATSRARVLLPMPPFWLTIATMSVIALSHKEKKTEGNREMQEGRFRYFVIRLVKCPDESL